MTIRFFFIINIALLLNYPGLAQTNPPPNREPLWKTLPLLPPMPVAADSGYAEVNAARIYYAIYNKNGGEPVVLLHGGMASSSYWAGEIPLLSKTHEVIVIDSRGHGRSTLSNEPFTYSLLASDIYKTLKKLDVFHPAIVGWSDGGIIGLILAMDHPELVSKLVTYGANFNESGYKTEAPDTAAGRKFRQQAETDYRRLSSTPDSFPRLRRMLFQMYNSEPDLDTVKLKTVQTPTLIVFGRYEQFITQEHFQKLADLMPNAGLLMLPNVSHGGPLQDPGGFHRAVMYLLEDKR